MIERGPLTPDSSDPRSARIESFLIRHIRANPGARFGSIVQASWVLGHIPRATAARHLSRLVKNGELTLRPDHTYILGDPAALISRAVIEVHWYENLILVHPDGTFRYVAQEEFRVVNGQLDHLELDYPKPVRWVDWWSTFPCSVSSVPRRHVPGRTARYRLNPATPLTPRQTAWQRVHWTLDVPRWYRMAYNPRATSKAPPTRGNVTTEFESIEIQSQTLRSGRRVAPDGHLRLQVMLPERYPIGRARSRVRFTSDLDRTDSTEEQRMADLVDDKWVHDGFRRSGTTLTLSVPQPRPDRLYEIVWDLPTIAMRDRWLKAPPFRDPRGSP